jgi:hypothetical protein
MSIFSSRTPIVSPMHLVGSGRGSPLSWWLPKRAGQLLDREMGGHRPFLHQKSRVKISLAQADRPEESRYQYPIGPDRQVGLAVVGSFLNAIRLKYDFSKKRILDAEVSHNTPLSLLNSMNTVPSSAWITRSYQDPGRSRRGDRPSLCSRQVFPETFSRRD